ncbi:hypothetical protein LCGC14_0905720 [marine sediment metagenome]|uniref:GIY-YIG domain-containing protein n=1 Tax=marine sediment metagenome TaxID=412755 RepID=A0A0F9S206_9ZZZZ
MTSGVYEILNVVTGKLYIGSSVELEKRFKAHASNLKLNSHHSIHLQRSYNKHGADAFVMFPIEFCDPDLLLEKEQFWIDALGAAAGGYNICPTAGSPRGSKRGPLSAEHRRKISLAGMGRKMPEKTRLILIKARTGSKHTEESKRKMSEALKGKPGNSGSFKPGSAPWNKGGHHSEESKRKMSRARKGKRRDGWITLTCAACGEEFEKKKNLYRRQGGKYCNSECYGKVLKGKPTWNKGLSPSAETRAKISKSLKARNAAERLAVLAPQLPIV